MVVQAKSQTTTNDPPKLFFRVSAGLKSLLGRDLIVSDFIAVFELVKNGFDARAKDVQIVFEEDAIWIIDDGKGMTQEDLINKWLVVAYSAKQDGTEDIDYRDNLIKRAYAGNKGVGRFSCDRLGSTLTLQSKVKKTETVKTLTVSWDRFEQNPKDDFVKIPVINHTQSAFELPKVARKIDRGTILKISNLRDNWSRPRLLELKSHLKKLINPFEAVENTFSIHLIAPSEVEADKKIVAYRDDEQEQLEDPVDQDEKEIRDVVNGPIRNFIFSDLAEKTTLIEIAFSDDSKTVITKLIDRSLLIYKISEPNPYAHLASAGFTCRIFYLNQSAKQTFARRVGVASVNFGSIFLFRNGFRVFPIGEPGDDTFEIDRRKQQGFSRFLGTRDVIGRIDVHGSDDSFKEATSRDQGLIKTPAYTELLNCFRTKAFKRLESYVVDVTWKDVLDKTREDSSGLMAAPARARIIELISALAISKELKVLEYNNNIVNLLSDKVEQFEGSLKDLRLIANSIGDNKLAKRISEAEKQYNQLKEAEQRARNSAEKERKARQKAEDEALEARKTANEARSETARAETALAEEKKRSTFLTALTSLDIETITNLNHQITICSADIHELIEVQIEKLHRKEKIDADSLFSFLEQMRLKNQHVMAIARLATKANFRLESDEIFDDIVAYFVDHLNNVTPLYLERIKVEVVDPEKAFERKFKPIEMSIVIDNLVVNARKAGAKKIQIRFEWITNAILKIRFSDNGDGFSKLSESPRRVFEKGFSTTDGSGLGLYHVRQIIESMGGDITCAAGESRGAEFEITLPKT